MSLGEGDFVGGMIRKTLGLGAVAAFLGACLHSWWMALSIGSGGGVSAGNLAVARLVAERLKDMAREDGKEQASQTRWAILLGAKTCILMAIAAFAVLVVGLDPFGFIGGYSLFLVALGWQTIEWNLEG